MKNRLFVVNKPIFRSSNGYMGYVKRKYNTKKVGFSGTLDPFATGCLITATGQYTKLFQYLKKSPKCYTATLWLGASSSSLDIENITDIKDVAPVDIDDIKKVLKSLEGEIEYIPPKYSAKKVNGKRAYDIARNGGEISLKKVHSHIYSIELIHYTHPFITFRAVVSEGTYIRSLAQIISEQLNRPATLSSLKREYEGEFHFENERALNPLDYLKTPKNRYLGDLENLDLGKKLNISDFEIQDNGIYVVTSKDFFSIIELKDSKVIYRLNRIEKFKEE